MFSRKTSLLTVIAILTASACSHLDESFVGNATPDMKKMTVEAVWGDEPETRTAMQSNGKIFWSPGDEINLFYGSSTASKFTATITDPSATASFEGMLGAATGSSEQGIATQTFWGIYPYDAANTCDGNGVTLSIKAAQTSRPGSFGEGMNPAVAVSPGLSLSFYNVGSWFKFTVNDEGITSATFSGNNGEDIAGRIRVTMDSSGKPEYEIVPGGGVKQVSVTPADGGTFIPGVSYYITLLPQTLAGGYSFTMFKGEEVATRKTSKSRTFGRSSHVSAEEIDDGLTWQSICVDMGDGLMWSTMNLGASTPEEYGDYFAWAETSPKSGYTWIGYKWGDYSTDMTKYVTKEGQGRDGFIDGKSVLEPEDDAASVNWGGDWRMPTEDEWLWLKDNCSWTPSNGGYIVTSSVNGNTIFLPAAGFKSNMQYFEGSGVYWSSTLDGTYSSQARALFFDGNNSNTTNGERYSGYSIRPVKGESISSKYVELGPGVKWAKMNIGASSAEDYGDYFAWGETSTKTDFSWDNYKWGTYSYTGSNLTRYVSNSDYGTVDGRTLLLPEDDAATAAWGGDWRTPTNDEWNWLTSNCTVEASTENGVSGYRFTSKVSGYEGNSIFIPSAGLYRGTTATGVGSAMSYWVANAYPEEASYLALAVSSGGNGWTGRCEGRPVRAVYMPRVSLTSFTLSTVRITVGVELKERIYTVCEPYESTEQGAIWSSSNPAVAKVSGWGEVTGVSPGTATVTAVSLDGGFRATCTVTVIESYVDMGGGMEWATFNVGAGSPTESGDYFAWGETAPKASYTWDNYRLGRENNIFYYNSNDGLVQLLPNRDAATYRMGGLWHTPSLDEWQWLYDHSTRTWVTNYNNSGVQGCVFTSTETGNSIFLPAVGIINENETEPSTTYSQYWSSSLYPASVMNYNYAGQLYLSNGYIDPKINNPRYYGCPVRAVRRKWVDMGDGLKWATTNVGGFNPEDYGDYFAWGETKGYDGGKTDFSWGTYKWMQEGRSGWQYITRYTYPDGQTEGIWYDGDTFVGDHQTRLSLSQISPDDAARANWGGTWRMPTDDEWTWLRDNCTWEWATENGVYGRKVTSNITGNTIFLPAAGDRDGTSLNSADSYGAYWSSSLTEYHSVDARNVYFDSGLVSRAGSSRFYGKSVRAVSE